MKEKHKYMVTVFFTVRRPWEAEKKIWDMQETYQVTATSTEQADKIARKRCEKSDRWILNEIERVEVAFTETVDS